jgi:hypothetical protein
MRFLGVRDRQVSPSRWRHFPVSSRKWQIFSPSLLCVPFTPRQ